MKAKDRNTTPAARTTAPVPKAIKPGNTEGTATHADTDANPGAGLGANVQHQKHHIQLLQGGAQFFPALVAAIDAAQSEVRLETYIFNDDASGGAVADALIRAARRGVKVFFVVDGVGTGNPSNERLASFKAAGVQCLVFSPLGRLGLLVPSRWRRLHRKLCVVDQRIAFCGGINLLDDFFDPGYGKLDAPRLDFAVMIEGPLVSDAAQAMSVLWRRLMAAGDWRQHRVRAAVRDLQRTEPTDATAPKVAAHTVLAELLLRDNFRNRTRIERAYRAAIAGAKTDIIIANAYFLPGRKLRQGLIHAARRGVRVRLLLQGRYEYFMQYHASRPVYDPLLAAGVEIHEYARSFLHAKVAVVDDQWATVGSSNLDPLSLLLAREANVVVRHAGFARDLRMQLEDVMHGEGAPVNIATLAKRPWSQRILDRFAFAVMRAALLVGARRY